MLGHLWEGVVGQLGNGKWPPVPEYEEAWSDGLRPYAQVCDESAARFVIPPDVFFADVHANRDSEAESFRRWLRCELEMRLDMSRVALEVEMLGAGGKQGLLCCLVHLAHMYRWGCAPVTIAAQQIIQLELPEAIAAPLGLISRYFGMQTGGSLYSMFYCNAILTNRDESTHTFNYSHRFGFCRPLHDSEPKATEAAFHEMNYRIEVALLPVYEGFVALDAMLSQANVDRASLSSAFQRIDEAYRMMARLFSSYLRVERGSDPDTGFVDPKLWIHYVQGPEGWDIEGEEGPTGAISIAFRMCDVLTGDVSPGTPTFDAVSTYLSSGAVPLLLREFVQGCLKANLRERLVAAVGEPQALRWIATISQRQVNFRQNHLSKVYRYFGEDTSYRLPMTAGGGVVNRCLREQARPTTGAVDKTELLAAFAPRLCQRVQQSRQVHQALCAMAPSTPAAPSASTRHLNLGFPVIVVVSSMVSVLLSTLAFVACQDSAGAPFR